MAEFRHLLDTNILSDLLRKPSGRVAQRVASSGVATICTSIIVACELRFGAAKKGSIRLSERIENGERRGILSRAGPPARKLAGFLISRASNAAEARL